MKQALLTRDPGKTSVFSLEDFAGEKVLLVTRGILFNLTYIWLLEAYLSTSNLAETLPFINHNSNAIFTFLWRYMHLYIVHI